MEAGAEAGGLEPAHPAPVLDLTASSGGTGTASPTTTAPTTIGTTTGNASGTPAGDSSDTLARILGVVGILIGLGALGYLIVARRRGVRI